MTVYTGIETITLDAIEFIGERSSLNLDELGIRVMSAEWGDAQQEVFYIRQELGEIPAERHPPNRTVTIKLKAMEEGEIALAQAAQRLQQKVGLLQQEGGWVKRSFSADNNAAVSVGFEVYNAVLAGIQGWMMAHRKTANEITLTLTCSPYCYGTKELEGSVVTSSNGHDVEWEIGSVKGSAPGLLRLKIKNTGSIDWSGFIGSIESKDHKSGSTALMAYEAKALTFTGSEEFEKESVKTVRRKLTAEWQTILQGKIASGSLDMTHVGGRRMLVRLYNEAVNVEGTRLRLEWRALNGLWQVNDEVEARVISGWMILDVGEAVIERAVYGEQAWEWKLQVKTAKAETNKYIYIHKIYPLAQEQFFAMRKAYLSRIPPSYIINGELSEGVNNEAINGKAMVTGGGKWETSGSAKGDFLKIGAVGSGNGFYRAGTGADTELRKAFVSSPSKSNVYIQTAWSGGYFRGPGKVREYGLFAHGENIKVAIVQECPTEYNCNWYLEVTGAHVVNPKRVEIIPGTKNSAFAPGLFTVSIVGKKMVVYVKMYLSWITELSFELNATTEGKVGVFDKHTDVEQIGGGFTSITCSQFLVYEPEVDVLLNAGRYMNLSSNGVFVQHGTLERWGEIPLHEGFLPDATPSYLEARVLKGILIPSQGDLELLGDPGSNALEVVPFYRPAYHFMSEAST
jgi:hypothetical protein